MFLFSTLSSLCSSVHLLTYFPVYLFLLLFILNESAIKYIHGVLSISQL